MRVYIKTMRTIGDSTHNLICLKAVSLTVNTFFFKIGCKGTKNILYVQAFLKINFFC